MRFSWRSYFVFLTGYPNIVATYGRGYSGFAPSYSYQFPGKFCENVWLLFSDTFLSDPSRALQDECVMLSHQRHQLHLKGKCPSWQSTHSSLISVKGNPPYLIWYGDTKLLFPLSLPLKTFLKWEMPEKETVDGNVSHQNSTFNTGLMVYLTELGGGRLCQLLVLQLCRENWLCVWICFQMSRIYDIILWFNVSFTNRTFHTS